ncbi:hypothetical protein CCACVL1_23716 [Corchorus capsularis]|uniref:Uncharacterized protein n=1 Tax=Corchorus capsularis TaxID=210143 RepID=A0A1R3GSZ9_COCAP|nr:hypothetical protein CCACVL1_23716 [Corchorus capsularis]
MLEPPSLSYSYVFGLPILSMTRSWHCGVASRGDSLIYSNLF